MDRLSRITEKADEAELGLNGYETGEIGRIGIGYYAMDCYIAASSLIAGIRSTYSECPGSA